MLDFDLNEPLMEEENDGQDDEPFIGQTFESEDEAFVFYNNYAKQHRFVVRKDRSDTRNERTIRRDVLCHRAGKQRLKVADHFKPQRNKKSSKCDCKAHMRITLKMSFDIFPEEWHVTKFVNLHNHASSIGKEVIDEDTLPEDEYIPLSNTLGGGDEVLPPPQS
ncbi:hypothetical protein V6N11_046741 [Hibiscus sabdariffa]|uniref:FAR1 domain-containing protein n=1 Tax=Hibiscus sabdariffa TaxID=183260 RepID=A0ABR2NGP1_9ROSI